MSTTTITVQGVSYTLTGSSRGELVLRPVSNPQAAGASEDETYGEFKFHDDWHQDEDGKVYSAVVIRQLIVAKAYRRRGHATEIIREIAKLYPNSLIQGENPSHDAEQLHISLNKTFPSRMLDFDKPWGTEKRVTPGEPLDPDEL